jgi:hypothetical protein
MSASESHPRSVTPGIETQLEDGKPYLPPPGVYVRLDWLRFTGPDELHDDIVALANEWFGDEARWSTGAAHFSAGLTWDPGVQISTGHSAQICMIDVRGERLSQMKGDDQMRLLVAIGQLGVKPTRIDGAIDWVGQQVNLYDNAVASCERGELCIMRRFSPSPELTANGAAVKKLLKLGKRESPVCARIYDKGLEQGFDVEGYWERLEVEWKKGRAAEVGRRLVDAGDGWPELLTGFVLGAIDFRECNGRSELQRRPRAEWWTSLLGESSAQRVICIPRTKLFTVWVESFRRSYGRRIVQMADAVGAKSEDVAAWLLRHVSSSQQASPIMTEFCRAWQSRSRSGSLEESSPLRDNLPQKRA